MSEEPYRGTPLDQIRFEPGEAHGDKITTWENERHAGIYILRFKPLGDGGGFHFVAYEWYSSEESEELYSVVAFGTAYFDGMRHLYFGDPYDDALGYLHYPKTDQLAALLTELRTLETLYCNGIGD